MRTEPTIWQMDIADIPGHSLILSECRYPDSIDGGWDIALGETCAVHGRSIHWCLNVNALWCDGGPPEYEYHLCRNWRE